MDIVMPLVAADLDRYLRLQRPTFERFYGDLGTTRIIAPGADRQAIRAATSHLPGIKVLDERVLVPELVLRRWSSTRVSNWYVQQLVKLAAVARAHTPFVLVLDADVFAVRPVTDRDLVVDGRALRPTRRRAPIPTGSPGQHESSISRRSTTRQK